MSDDLNNRGAADRQRINIGEQHEITYWSKQFNVTPEKLKEAVQSVGPMATDVEKKLKG